MKRPLIGRRCHACTACTGGRSLMTPAGFVVGITVTDDDNRSDSSVVPNAYGDSQPPGDPYCPAA